MPLDIHFDNPQNELLMSFDGSEGLYWFIYPVLEQIADETGVMIDLYDDATFEHELLMELFLGLDEAISLLKTQPMSWKVEISKDVPSGKSNYSTIDQKAAIDKLEKLKVLANNAYNEGRKLVFIGD